MWARAGHREGGSSEPYGTCWVGDVQGGSFSYLSDVWAGRVIGMPLLHAALCMARLGCLIAWRSGPQSDRKQMMPVSGGLHMAIDTMSLLSYFFT